VAAPPRLAACSYTGVPALDRQRPVSAAPYAPRMQTSAPPPISVPTQTLHVGGPAAVIQTAPLTVGTRALRLQTAQLRVGSVTYRISTETLRVGAPVLVVHTLPLTVSAKQPSSKGSNK